MKLSYIITTYNRPHLLEGATACILREKVEDSELIIVDDCSAEPVSMPASALQAFGARSQLIRNPVNLGVIGARNAGIAAATGEYIIFLDDDDTSEPHRSRDLLDAIWLQGTDFAAAHAYIRSGASVRVVPEASHGQLNPLKLLLNPPHINAVIWRRDFLLETNGMDNRVPYFGEHVTLMLGLMRGKTGYLSEKIVATFGYLEDGLTEAAQGQKKLHQDLQGYFRLLTEASEDPGLTRTFVRIQEMLETGAVTTYDDFLAKLYRLLGNNGA